jgi:hypothetical protein
MSATAPLLLLRSLAPRTRCITPASGYYEWQDTPGGKQPHYFTRVDGQVISFAGLWGEWKDRTSGETVKSCTMIITELNPWSRKFTTAVDVSKVPITDIAPQLMWR